MAIAMANFGALLGHKILPRTRGGAGSYYCGGLDCNGLSMGADHRGNVLLTAPGDPGVCVCVRARVCEPRSSGVVFLVVRFVAVIAVRRISVV